MLRRTALVMLVWAAAWPALAQLAPNRYALILKDPPASSRFPSKTAALSVEATDYRQRIEAAQRTLLANLAARNIQVTGSVTAVLNAVFVLAPKERVAELSSLPGVVAVVPVRRYKLELNRATQLVNAPAAWSSLGGSQNAGRGIKIGVLDTGIDQTHPAFQDSSLPVPMGYPICSGGDCAFTNDKVIVARSYVRQLAAGTDPAHPAADSRPDDYSPRDHQGHGTAIASAIAGVANTGTVTFNGMAPKAYLGNYKIYGSPEVNETTSDDVIIQALEDALNDGMDIVSFSTGGPAFSGALDSGSACGNPTGVPCDLSAQAFENAAKAGLVIAVAAGNAGRDGTHYPTLNSISSPANAPSVIAVGATSNSHYFAETVGAEGSGAPSNLKGIAGDPGNAYVPPGAVTAPLVDVTQLGDDGLACSQAKLPTGSLTGAFALIERGTCNFSVKLANAENAGAVGVIFYMADASPIISMGGLAGFSTPAIMVSNTDGLALKSYVNAKPGSLVTIDPAGAEKDWPYPNELIPFSSFGPSAGEALLKPELVAPGFDMYMATQSYDPLGIMYSSNRYVSAAGTSFSTPLVAGAAALVLQAHPTFRADQVKSVLVNTASQDVTVDEMGNTVGVQALGAGKLNAGGAVGSTVTCNPATVSFGVVKALPLTRPIQVTNSGTGTVTLTVAILQTSQAVGTTLTLDKQSLTLAPNASSTVTLTLGGTFPPAGSYSGALTLQSSDVSLRVPYLFLAPSGAASNLIPLTGDSFDGTVGETIPWPGLSFKLVDAGGVPVSGVSVTWSPAIVGSDSVTDVYGIATAQPVLGSAGIDTFTVSAAGDLAHIFTVYARAVPNIPSNGVVDAAKFTPANPVAPGSYISIFGTGLSDTTNAEPGSTLPLAIDYVNVSFDVPSAGISVPGHLIYVSPTQLNVQVPWELQGQISTLVKVTIDYTTSNVVTVPLADYAPAFFEFSPGTIAALDANNRVIEAGNGARPGQVIHLFVNGLGPVTNQPASGQPALSPPLSQTTTQPTVSIGTQPAQVGFSGLTPFLTGLYQIDVTVPSGLSPGTYPVSVTIGGKTSKVSSLLVQ